MRYGKENVWRKCFVWFPMRVEEQKVWLEMVEYKKKYIEAPIEGYYQIEYRLIKH